LGFRVWDFGFTALASLEFGNWDLELGIWDLPPQLFGIWVLGFGACCLRQRPRPKIIQENQATAILLRKLALNAREIRERSKLKSSAQWPKEIVLMTR
jgi:hypothetical protein